MAADRSLIQRAAGVAFAMVLACTAAAGTARAQELSQSHLEAARETIAASQSTLQLDAILPNLGEQVKQQLINNRPDAALQVAEIVDNVTVELAPRRGDLEAEVARIYAQLFTEEELKQLTAFYQSPTGQKMLAQAPVLSRSIEQAARVWTTGIQRDLEQQVRQKIEAAGLN